MAEHVASTGFSFRESSTPKFRGLEVIPSYKLLSSPALHTVPVATIKWVNAEIQAVYEIRSQNSDILQCHSKLLHVICDSLLFG